ncbi:MAG: SMP-30/gluconolactonase/LRE family protein [Polyangiales bacterium]
MWYSRSPSRVAVGEVQPFGDPVATRTEGITFDAADTLFVSAIVDDGDDQLLRSLPDSSQGVVAESESILGLASDTTGILAAAIRTGELLLIDPATGVVTPIADGLGAPNFVVTTPWGTTLVSDDTPGTDTIREVPLDGDVSVWVEGVPTPNGTVFSLDNRTLYVAATFEGVGLWRVPVSVQGEAGTPEQWVSFNAASTPDGVAIDSERNVYVALNINDEIAQVKPDGTVTIIAEGVDTAASLAFGQGEYDPCLLYVTNLFDAQVWRVGIEVLGPEN